MLNPSIAEPVYNRRHVFQKVAEAQKKAFGKDAAFDMKAPMRRHILYYAECQDLPLIFGEVREAVA
ncbi:hypothetical protein GWA01_20460 [Gluconobacter wancherniae NBRC 103581]|uniref:Uncharacterized protein n=1 Tax=Gluconobacter wancherniae NBRC 103581 TaxID=656744 RepID=A0A511B1F1_9PROT|nr:hypothetical protein AA103581_1548 [Gluconobacter wancherniae NBRC 103581]GEK94276.1 hypothetical protein GWA01_20460 [Gluconobacter wancherniae NBRC 103581]